MSYIYYGNERKFTYLYLNEEDHDYLYLNEEDEDDDTGHERS